MSVNIVIDNTPIEIAPLVLTRNDASILCNESYRVTVAGDSALGIKLALDALKIDPEHMEAHCNLGLAYWSAERYTEAAASFEKSISIKDNAMSRLNLGILSLGVGNFKEGWAGYKHRFAAHGRTVNATMPEWDGGALDGTLFVVGEQGIGDQILFASMIQSLHDRGIKFIWMVTERLLPLFEYAFPDTQFLVPGGDRPENWGDVKAYIHAPDLGQYLRPNAKSFPAKPYLNIPPAAMGVGLKIGISWRSSNPKNGAAKSAELAQWAGLFKASARFINLQYGSTVEELEGLAIETVIGLDLMNDFENLAQIVAACDLVITVSNSVAHLACAMGKPTWVMVPRGIGKYWCWGYHGGRSRWYPTARVFRQIDAGDWGTTLDEVGRQLSEHVA